jgi:hypothetical protein
LALVPLVPLVPLAMLLPVQVPAKVPVVLAQ